MTSKLDWQFQTVPGWAGALVNSAWVKYIDPPLANPTPGARAVCRVYYPDEETNALIREGEAGADKWVDRTAPTMLTRPWVWAWELPNEPQPVADWTFCQQLGAFTKQAARRLRALGLRSVGGNLAEGNPGGVTDTERANLFCALAVGLAECDYWSQHTYWIPDGYNHAEAGYNQWHARRDRLNAEYARARGIRLPPRLLTEAGLDGGIVGRPKQGWRDFCPDFRSYLAELQRFDDDLADEDDVLAALLFVSGALPDWTRFAIEEPESVLLREYIANRGGAGAQPATAEATPRPVYVAPFGLARPLVGGRVSQWWGVNVAAYAKIAGLTKGHNGIDYAAPRGTPVLACHDGVVYTANDPQGYGLHVKLIGDGHYTLYGHLSEFRAANGQRVRTGQPIGAVGNTGWSTGEHLHLGWGVFGIANPGFLDKQDPALGRAIYDAAQRRNASGGAT